MKKCFVQKFSDGFNLQFDENLSEKEIIAQDLSFKKAFL
jgi:hypothetical protein